MKATLEFNLPEDKEEFLHAQKGGAYAIALCEIRELFRERIKYGDLPMKALKEVESLQDEFFEIVDGLPYSE